jgi:hypothetical protein
VLVDFEAIHLPEQHLPVMVALFSTLPSGVHNKKAQNLPLPLSCVHAATMKAHTLYTLFASRFLVWRSEIFALCGAPLQQFPPCWFAE